MAVDDKGYWPTKDGRFQGRKIVCAVCGRWARRPDMVWQRGYLVHRDTCYDDIGNNPMGQTQYKGGGNVR
jgi:hypothetical protein